MILDSSVDHWALLLDKIERLRSKAKRKLSRILDGLPDSLVTGLLLWICLPIVGCL